MKFKALILSAMLLPAFAFASPSEQSLTKLAETMPYEALFFEAAIAPIEEERMALAYGLSNDNALTDEQRKKAMQAFDEYAEKLVKTLDTKATKDELKKAYINAARQNFTQAEVDAQIAFYGSKDGKSALEKSQKVYGDYLKSVSTNAEKTIESYQKTNLTKMQDKIKQILGK